MAVVFTAMLAAALAAGPVPAGDAAETAAPRVLVPVPSHDAAAPEALGPLLAMAPSGDLVAMAGLPPLTDSVLAALPPPPAVAVRHTRTYGTITIDHVKHLAVRARCHRCHDPGPVTKIVFTPKIAHQRCVGCHKERQAGPTACVGCHVKTAPPAPPAAVASASDAAATGMTPRGALVASHARLAPGTRPGRYATPGQMVEFGFGSMNGLGGSVRLTRRWDRFYRSYSLERYASAESARTMSLVDFGYTFPFGNSWSLVGSGVVGFHGQERPQIEFSAALGARLRLEWAPPPRWRIEMFHLSLASIRDFPERPFGGGSAETRMLVMLGTSLRIR